MTLRQPSPRSQPSLHLSRGTPAVLLVLLALTVPLGAADPPAEPEAPATFQWSGADAAGRPVKVPSPKRVSVLVFVMAGQQRSLDALKHVQQVAKEHEGVTPIAVISGQNAAIKAKQLAELAGWPHAIVADEPYTLSGVARVRAWPTTLVVDEQGRQAAPIAGLTNTYLPDLAAYVDHAAGRIDQAQLKERLASRAAATDRQNDVAARHLGVAQGLIEMGKYTQAADELKQVLDLKPDDARAQVLMAQVEVRLGKARDALTRLDKVDASGLAPWQAPTVRGLALATLGRWNEAKAALAQAIRLNPKPAESHYLLGRAHEQASEWRLAAQAYRAAYESSRGATVAPGAAPQR